MVRVGPIIHFSWDSQITQLRYGVLMLRHGTLKWLSNELEAQVSDSIISYVEHYIERQVSSGEVHSRYKVWRVI